MALSKVQLRPGINKELTSYANEGGWFDGDKVRFRKGVPEKIGGWEKLNSNTFQGTCRAIHPWIALDGTDYFGIGTHLKYYVLEGIDYNDITPIRATFESPTTDNCFDTVSGSTTVTVNITNHGANDNDFVIFSGATAVGGVAADDLNTEFQVTLIDANSFEITVANAATSTATGGGTGISAEFQIAVGLDTTVFGTGWGVGVYGRSEWSSNADIRDASGANILRIWSHDNFGEDIIINVRDAGVYYWDTSANSGSPFGRAVALSDRAGADATTPTVATKVLVSDRDRHVILFGTDPVDNIGTQDRLLIRFCSSEDPTKWNPEATNTAGSLRLSKGSEIVTAVETRQQILVWTDISLHSMQFLGPPFTFGIQQLSANTTIISPNSPVPAGDVVYWMGIENFYVFDGQVKPLPCDVKSYVFDDFNKNQREKVFGVLNSSFGEVWWFYPSEGDDPDNPNEDIDRYVVYNYLENIWYIGTLSRTAAIDRGVDLFPIAAGGQYLYLHERGNDDDGSAMTSYIESSQIDIEDGDHFAFISRVIPDLTFTGSAAESPKADFTVKVRRFPGANYDNSNSNEVVRSSTTPVEQFTNQVYTRLRGRSFALRVESDESGVQWRLGAPRLDIRRDGRK